MGNAISRFEISATDLKTVRDFYTRLFDWSETSDDRGRFSIVDAGAGPSGMLLRADPGIPTFVTVYVEVDDVDAYLKKAEQLGGTIYVPATDSPVPGERRFGLFGDPEGNIVGVCERA